MIKRIFLWSLAIIVVFVVAIVLAFRFTPWPSVAIIQQAFSRGDQASEAALEKHVPDNIVTRRDIAYGEGPDEIFDVNYPEGTSGPLPTIVWVHGGGWVAGSKAGIANYLKVLAGHGYTTVGVEYSHGFGSTYPKPVEQVNAALGYIVRNAADLNIDPNTIILAGDSAGAQIASQLAVVITDPSYAERMGTSPSLEADRLAAVLLLSGGFDIEAIDLEGDFGWFLKTVLWAYSGTRDFMNDERFRLISVAHYVTGAFPPAFVSSGNGDPLAPQAVALVQRLEELGVTVDGLFFPADYSPPLPHEYQFNLDTAAGQEALERMLAFIEASVQP
jgi:acetyl esterase/lipase